ncbi:MAG: ECF transporter S component [Ruminococcaceae bacterium]|nr:ECF transporter S component [Oscillospiraceae bacterium]
MKIKKLVMAAVFAALTFVGTSIIKIPTINGYIHPGDGFVLLAGFLLGPIYGACSAGIGSALADLLGGYGVYVPGTFVIKGITALAAALIYQRKKSFPLALSGAIVGELLMALGYLIYETLIFGEGAWASVPGNLVQGAGGVVISLLLLPIIKGIFKS